MSFFATLRRRFWGGPRVDFDDRAEAEAQLIAGYDETLADPNADPMDRFWAGLEREKAVDRLRALRRAKAKADERAAMIAAAKLFSGNQLDYLRELKAKQTGQP